MPESFNFLPVLEGASITIRPATAADFEPLYSAASDPEIWTLHPDPERYKRDVFERNFFAPAIAGTGALVVVDRETQSLIGSSRFYEWNSAAEEICIGYTFLARSHWGGDYNREMKGLMLQHAFQFSRRVWIHIGIDNFRSRKAMEKIGGKLSHTEFRNQGGRQVENCYYFIDRDDPGVFK